MSLLNSFDQYILSVCLSLKKLDLFWFCLPSLSVSYLCLGSSVKKGFLPLFSSDVKGFFSCKRKSRRRVFAVAATKGHSHVFFLLPVFPEHSWNELLSMDPLVSGALKNSKLSR